MADISKFLPLWGVWQIDAEIGQGSFGRVYRAVREEFGRRYHCAIKHISVPENDNEVRQFLKENATDDTTAASQYYEQLVQEINNEINTMYRLNGNTNIVAYQEHLVLPKEQGIGYDIFIKMELLTELSDRIKEAAFTQNDAVRLGVDICTALEVCAANNLIHRDIKPQNIFINSEGSYKLGDFGISRQLEKTMSGLSKKGTYSYMAPEVYKGGEYGPNVDIYSLGLVLYRLMNGNRLPFLPLAPNPVRFDDNERALSRRIQGEELPAPAFADEAFTGVILRMCAYDKDARFKTATEAKQHLLALAGNDKVVPLVSAVGSGTLTQAPQDTGAAPDTAVQAAPAEADKTQGVLPQAPTAQQGEQTVNVFAAPAAPQAAPPAARPGPASGAAAGAGRVQQVNNNGAKPKGKKKWMLFGGIGVAAVAVLCVALFLVLGNQGGPKTASRPASAAASPPTAPAAVLDEAVAAMPPMLTDSGLIFDSVVWGEYVAEGYVYGDRSTIDENTGADFLDGMSFEEGVLDGHDAIGLSVVPWSFEAGTSYLQSQYYANLPGYSFAEVSWYSPLTTSIQYGYRVYKIENGKLLVNNSDLLRLQRSHAKELDESDIFSETVYVQLREQLPALLKQAGWTEYALSFEGRNLVLTREDKNISVTMVPLAFEGSEDVYPQPGAYASYSDRVYQDIVNIIYEDWGGTYSQISQSIRFSNGSRAVDPAIVFYDNGYMTIKWEQKDDPVYGVVDEPGDILCGYILSCSTSSIDDGLILIDPETGALYPYQSSKEDFEAGGWGSFSELESAAASAEAAALEALRAEMLQELRAAFADAGVSVNFDEETGEISMSSSILFDFDSAELSDAGKVYLDGFLDVYAAVVLSDAYAGSVAEIMVEGHTDTDGEYGYNLTLSEQRAQSVSRYCLESQPELAQIMAAKGCASDFPIYGADGEVDMEASRRVVFRFVLQAAA